MICTSSSVSPLSGGAEGEAGPAFLLEREIDKRWQAQAPSQAKCMTCSAHHHPPHWLNLDSSQESKYEVCSLHPWQCASRHNSLYLSSLQSDVSTQHSVLKHHLVLFWNILLRWHWRRVRLGSFQDILELQTVGVLRQQTCWVYQRQGGCLRMTSSLSLSQFDNVKLLTSAALLGA